MCVSVCLYCSMIADVFIVRRTDFARPIVFSELGQLMDICAPMPWLGVCPNGETIAAFAVDFHQSPAIVCARLGFTYCHVEFVDVEAENYRPDYVIGFGDSQFSWVKLFHSAWSREAS